MRVLLSILAFSFAASSVPVASQAQDRAALLSSAWDSYNSRKYDDAIRAASSCVIQFGRQAQRDQARIEAGKSPPEPEGATAPNTPEAKRTFANGVLNDGAACMFILAKSQEQIQQCPDAKKVYQDLAKLTHARVWDPHGWFWKPSDAAEDAFAALSGRC
jgi:hypothetical protein